MTAVAQAISTRRLGRDRWRVELALEGPARAHPLRVEGDDSERVRIESLVVPTPSARDRFSVVLTLTGDAPAAVELAGEGWRGAVRLAPSELPRPAEPHAASPVPAAVDYTARDFDALRTMLLGVVDEQGLAEQPVSQTSALIEEIAYLGDALSYHQDAIATEAYLASARRRVSVTRQAALLDYPVSLGRSARTWVRFSVEEALELPAGTAVLAHAAGLGDRVPTAILRGGLPARALVFETLEPVALTPDHVPLPGVGRLALGAVEATLEGRCEALGEGTLALLEPASGPGQVVRVTQAEHGRTTRIAWDERDALRAFTGPFRVRAGNLALADHGRTYDWAPLPPPVGGRRYWPELPERHPAPSAGTRTGAAAEILAGGHARPAVHLRDGAHRWYQRASLLESGPLDPAFVVEVEEDGRTRLRFGDGTNGLRPPSDAAFSVRMRAGGGAAGNVGAGAITGVVSDDPRVRAAGNVVAAVGGEDPEPLERVRLFAPRSFRMTERAVLPVEYSRAALAVEGVADAATIIVPSGAGPVARVRVHAGGWEIGVAPLVARVRERLERLRPAGVALDVAGATPMPASVALSIVAEPGWTFAALAATVDVTLREGLLTPGRFGFGTRLHRSDLVRMVAALPGVLDVTLARFDWTSRDGSGRLEDLEPPFGHVIRIDNDPAAPEHGTVSFRLGSAG
ncbi:baseplate J/gp47 family protein [Solirubrobacter soli]|uniref:baseplate J/gp47 family protein n=1 Tax=Solirubrobacter soli TaxID=363832 RepID=UPI000411792A|nr:baseplate J/gp47 family protein [Solirubrobacter soli]